MSDRELLELAAKAAGINHHHIDEKGVWYSTHHMHESVYCWNPLTDDGDALRLAVKLGLIVDANGMHTRIAYPFEKTMLTERHNDDPFAATRRAIVRAAAEIGKAMP